MMMKLTYFTQPHLELDFFQNMIAGWDTFDKYSKLYIKLIDSYPNFTVICQQGLVENVVKDVKFFRGIDMITEEDAEDIRMQRVILDELMKEREATS